MIEFKVQGSKSKVQGPRSGSFRFVNARFLKWVEPMAEIKRFEDIEAWRRARQLVQAIYEVTSTGDFAKDFGLKDQIRRAGVSVMCNIVEGFERGGDKEFLQFLALAKASGGEVRSQLYVALHQNYLNEGQLRSISEQAILISQVIAGFMRYLQQSDLCGSKYLRSPL